MIWPFSFFPQRDHKADFLAEETIRLFGIYKKWRDDGALKDSNMWMMECGNMSSAPSARGKQSDADLERLARIHADERWQQAATTPLPPHIANALRAGKSVAQIQDDWINEQRRKSYEGTPEGRLRKHLHDARKGKLQFIVSTTHETLGGFVQMCDWGLENGWLTAERFSESITYTPTDKAWEAVNDR